MTAQYRDNGAMKLAIKCHMCNGRESIIFNNYLMSNKRSRIISLEVFQVFGITAFNGKKAQRNLTLQITASLPAIDEANP